MKLNRTYVGAGIGLVAGFTLAVGVLAGVVWTSTPETKQLPSCTLAFAQHKVVTDEFADNGCLGDNGELRKPTVHKCRDGRRYVQMGNTIGFVGESAEGGDTGSAQYDAARTRGWEAIYKIQCGS